MEINLSKGDVLKNNLDVENKEHISLENKRIVVSENNKFDRRLKDAGIFEFKRHGDCIDGKVKVYHEKCGEIISVDARGFFYKKHKCPTCAEREKQEIKNREFQLFLDEKFNKEIKLLSDYKRADKHVKLQHINCGSIFYKTKKSLMNKHSVYDLCDCKGENENYIKRKIALKNQKFDNKLRKNGLIEYIRKSDYVDCDTDIEIFHIKCNRQFTDTPKNFFRKTHHCRYCYKKEVGKRKLKSIPKNDFYQKKLDDLTNCEFELLSDYYNLNTYVKLKHRVCGHEFVVRADNFEKGKEKCPSCAERARNSNRTFSEKRHEIEELLNFEYEVVTKCFNMNDTIKLRHKECGSIVEKKACLITQHRNTGKAKVKCSHCENELEREEFLDELSRLYGNDYSLKGNSKYRGLYKDAILTHKVCGKSFKLKPIYMLKNTANREYCPNCKDEFKEREFKNKIKEYYNDEYELVGSYKLPNKKVKLYHKRCGSIIEKYKTNLLKEKNICSKCNKEDALKEREQSVVSRMKERYGDNIVLKGPYQGMKTKTKFHCNNCNNDFENTPDAMVSRTKKCLTCGQ